MNTNIVWIAIQSLKDISLTPSFMSYIFSASLHCTIWFIFNVDSSLEMLQINCFCKHFEPFYDIDLVTDIRNEQESIFCTSLRGKV